MLGKKKVKPDLPGPYRVTFTVFNSRSRSYSTHEFLVEDCRNEVDALSQSKAKLSEHVELSKYIEVTTITIVFVGGRE